MNTNPYDRQFFEGHLDGAIQSARQIVPILLQYIPCSSVIDVGCGLGAWLSVFADHGITDFVGVDGEYIDCTQLVIPVDKFIPWDLKRKLVVNRQYDLVVSLEVAEHLPEDCAEDFVNSLVALGDLVLFSASIPHQEGIDHINEQWLEYWLNAFENHGFLPVDLIRGCVWQNEKVNWWYAQNTLLYVRKNVVERYPALMAASESCYPKPLSYVHPAIYVHKEESLVTLTARISEQNARIHELEKRIDKLTSPAYLVSRLPSYLVRRMKELLRLP